ncbi:MAG: GntR family transcriptional regulator [Draconibacterium sp.]|nr:GntR family transcriptional regulator [Draconibacterium sp.]
MTALKYVSLQNFLKEQIQQGKYKIGDYLPSENQLCVQFSITRTTVRKALDELVKEGFIERQHGKGSRVVERSKSLGLLAVKGFSEAVGENVKTTFLHKPAISEWSDEIQIPVKKEHRSCSCLFFERLRCVGDSPVMHEKNWFPDYELSDFLYTDFVDGSFFKTLSKKYLIEIVGSTSELRAEFAKKRDAELLQIKVGSPILHISIVFFTSNPKLNIYCELYCNTKKFPIGSTYYL